MNSVFHQFEMVLPMCFLPGTSTIKTRAKYFFIESYNPNDLEYDKTVDSQELLYMLDDIERRCGEILIESGGECNRQLQFASEPVIELKEKERHRLYIGTA